MTRERFEQIKAAAAQMPAEIEWADFPAMPEPARTEFRATLTRMAADPEFQNSVQAALEQIYQSIDHRIDSLPARQEVELEAAGLVQLAAKAVFRAALPDPAADAVVGLQLRTKFRRLMDPLTEAPRNARVPSMSEQRRRSAMGLPSIDHPAAPDSQP